jgi:hypothetical protein
MKKEKKSIAGWNERLEKEKEKMTREQKTRVRIPPGCKN